MFSLRRDNTFGPSVWQKKVFIQSIVADVVAGSTSWISAKTKEYEFNLCGNHDVIPHYICTSTRPDPYFSEGAAAPDHSTSVIV